MRPLPVPHALADAQESGAAVPHQQRDGQRDNGYRKYHVGSPVSQIPHATADENLIHNIIQSRHQKRHDAGNGKLQHQRPHRFLCQISVCLFIHMFDSSYCFLKMAVG